MPTRNGRCVAGRLPACRTAPRRLRLQAPAAFPAPLERSTIVKDGSKLLPWLSCLALLGCESTQSSHHIARASWKKGDQLLIESGDPGGRPQLFEGLGEYQRRFSTSSREAHAYLVQGAIWTQAFNYDEAIRCFQEAARLDPECAMAWWGIAYAAGPSYNHARMSEERARTCWDAMQKARARIDRAWPVERALIEALSARFEMPYPLEDDSRLDQAYADAMGKVWERFPDDADVGMLYAEALMVRNPWKLYGLDREPAEDTAKIEALLERVLELNPNLPGACHLYIHAVELSKTPERGLAVADRLSTLVPLSGHLLHMPSHIYTRTGQWERAIEQNALAMEADERYRALSPDHIIQHMYQVHNNHIRAYAAMMVGREAEALEVSRRMWSQSRVALSAEHVP